MVQDLDRKGPQPEPGWWGGGGSVFLSLPNGFYRDPNGFQQHVSQFMKI